MAEKIVKDSFEQTLDIGDEVIYTHCQKFIKGNVIKFTHAGSVVVDNYPTGYYQTNPRRWVNSTKRQSLGKYKECVKLNVTSSNLNLTNSGI
tara:strand:- start:40 stop:315 length:276 start_codon:yes stop_codon:yes gene_type:complete